MAINNYMHRRTAFPHSQRGVVLIIGLIMVLLMAIIGVSAIRGSNMQEVMVGNMKDRNQAFQAAEAGLRVGESQMQTSGDTLVFENKDGLFTNQNLAGSLLGSVSLWGEDIWKTHAVSIGKSKLDLGLPKQPDYVVERLEVGASGASASGDAIEYGANVEEAGPSVLYRITSRGFGASESSVVILQSTYRVQH